MFLSCLPCECMQCNAWYCKIFLSVCLSVCLSNVQSDIPKETCAHILIPHETSFILVSTRRMVDGDDHFNTGTSTWNFGSSWSLSFKNADFQAIFARSASAIISIAKKNSIITNRKSTIRAFHEPKIRWTAYVACKTPKWGLRNAKWPFSV